MADGPLLRQQYLDKYNAVQAAIDRLHPMVEPPKPVVGGLFIVHELRNAITPAIFQLDRAEKKQTTPDLGVVRSAFSRIHALANDLVAQAERSSQNVPGFMKTIQQALDDQTRLEAVVRLLGVSSGHYVEATLEQVLGELREKAERPSEPVEPTRMEIKGFWTNSELLEITRLAMQGEAQRDQLFQRFGIVQHWHPRNTKPRQRYDDTLPVQFYIDEEGTVRAAPIPPRAPEPLPHPPTRGIPEVPGEARRKAIQEHFDADDVQALLTEMRELFDDDSHPGASGRWPSWAQGIYATFMDAFKGVWDEEDEEDDAQLELPAVPVAKPCTYQVWKTHSQGYGTLHATSEDITAYYREHAAKHGATSYVKVDLDTYDEVHDSKNGVKITPEMRQRCVAKGLWEQ